MNKTKIEWVKNPDGSQGFTSNPIKGYCPMACYYCFSRQDYDRFGWDKTIRWDADEMDRLMRRRKSAGIFIGSMHEIFLDEYIERGWTQGIIQYAELAPECRIYLLTKQPQNLAKFSPFPDNCWVGVTATDHDGFLRAIYRLRGIEATVKFISFEPLLKEIPFQHQAFYYAGIKWVIIGAQTRPYNPPKVEWVEEIVQACDKARIPVFLKDNLLVEHDRALAQGLWGLERKQELPELKIRSH